MASYSVTAFMQLDVFLAGFVSFTSNHFKLPCLADFRITVNNYEMFILLKSTEVTENDSVSACKCKPSQSNM